MARTRTTKKLAQRIDLNYFKRSTPYKRARLLLVVLAPLLAAGWIGWRGYSRDSRVYSSGRMSGAHAVLEKQCQVCHLVRAGSFSSKAVDEACQACHDGPVHHETAIGSRVPQCATCHAEHRGPIDLRRTSNAACADCHADLGTAGAAPGYSGHIHSFERGHPEFAALRDGRTDPATIRLNHFLHMKPIRRGPNGPMVQLGCGDCHRTAAASGGWIYGDARLQSASVSYGDRDEYLAGPATTLAPARALDGREFMAPVKFANACAGCHSLAFDKRLDEVVPHDKPEVVRAFVVRKLQEYIAAHPRDLQVIRDPNRDLTGKPQQPESRSLTPAQWVAERAAGAEELLWRKTCKQCHALETTTGSDLPRVAEARITRRWLPHAKFDHDAHRGFSCVGCHAAAVSSREARDILVPGIATCQACHAPGPSHAESRCFECHTYHDWAKRKDVSPLFTLPGLETGGR